MAQLRDAAPAIGEIAPDFTLKDTTLQSVSLSDYTDQTVVVAFFPAAFTSTCTKELCALRDGLASLNSSTAQVLGISVDLPYSLREFGKQQALTFPLLSDFDRQTISDYGVVDETFQGYHTGVAQRSVFIVGAGRIVLWRWISDKQGEQPDYREILGVVAQR